MHKRLSTSLFSALAALLLAVSTASASTEVGWGCAANEIGEGTTETVIEGTNSFLTRIPVTEGDSVGLYGPTGTLLCDKEAGAISLLHEGSVASGETKPFKGASEAGTPLRVVVEDDLDGDGYGDQSQDGCPESALFQTGCPIVALSVGNVSVRRRAILIGVGNNTQASVEAVGEVRWWAGSKTSDYRVPNRRAGLGTVVPKTVVPGTTVVLRVPLPKSVRRRLDRLSPQGWLRARIDVKATNLVPNVGTQELKVKLPGRARPQQPPRYPRK